MKLKHKITLVICLAFTSSFLFAGDGIQNEYLLETEEGYDLSQLYNPIKKAIEWYSDNTNLNNIIDLCLIKKCL